MRSRAPLVSLIAALCLAFSGGGATAAGPLSEVTDGLADAGVNVDVPAVPQVELPDVGIPPVDDAVDTVNDTLDGATDTVNEVTGADSPSDPPATTPPPTDTADPAPAGEPAETGSPAPATTGGGGGDGGSPGSTTGTGAGQQAGPGAGAAATAAGAAGTREPARTAGPADSPPVEQATTQSPFVTAFEALPVSIFVVIALLALIGLLMSGRSAARARLNRILRRQRGELQEDVGVLQSALLPAIPEKIGEANLAVAYRPAEGPAAGGDFHDVLTLADGRIGIVVGDVCGHGREALANTALVHYTVRAYLEAGLEPREALRLANQALSDKLGDDFVAVLAAVYDPAASLLEYATAGHPMPMVAGEGDRSVSVLTPPPVGVGLQTGHRQTRVSVRADSQIWFFTDGLVEARDLAGEMLGREGLVKVLGDEEDATPEAILARLATGEVRDDMTAVVLAPGDAGGDGVIEEEIDVDRELAKSDSLPRFLAACGLDPGEVERSIDAAQRRLRLAGSARIRARRGGLGPRWEISGAQSAPAPVMAGNGKTGATETILAGSSS